MTNILILLSSLVISAALFSLLLRFLRLRHRLSAAIVGLTLFHETVLVVFPALYTVFHHFELEASVSVSPSELAVVMAAEALFVAIFCGVFMMTGPHNQRTREESFVTIKATAGETRVLILFSLSGLVIYAHQLMSPTVAFSDVVHHADLNLGGGVFGFFSGLVIGAIRIPSLVASAWLLVDRTLRLPRLIAAATLCAISLDGISSGIRGRVTWVVSLIIIMAWLRSRKKIVYGAVAILLVLLPLFPYLGGSFRSVYYTEFADSSRFSALTFVGERFIEVARGRGSSAIEDQSLLQDLAERAQGPRNSVFLRRLADNGQSAGFAPISSAIYAPVPRFLWPNKRPAGSVDHTNFGQAIFLVRRVGYGSPIYNMGPVLASGHAYWEGGWAWLGMSALLTGALWGFLTRRATDTSVRVAVISLTFAFALPIDGFPTTLSPIYSLIAIFWSSVLPTSVALIYGSRLLQPRGANQTGEPLDPPQNPWDKRVPR